MHEAKTHLSRLVGRPQRGSRSSSRAGKPLVKVVAVDAPDAGRSGRLGVLAGRIAVPDDFDHMGESQIEGMFADEP